MAGPDGKSYLDEITLPPAAGTDPSALVSRLYTTDTEIGISPPGTFIDWHRVSTPRLLIVLKGEMEIGTGDGRRYRLRAGDMALAMDTHRAGPHQPHGGPRAGHGDDRAAQQGRSAAHPAEFLP